MTKQRIVVITGGGSGIGKAAALRFAEAGDKVFVLGRRQENLAAVAQEHGNIVPIVADVTDVVAIEKAVEIITSQHQTIDVLANCAGGNIKVEPDLALAEAQTAWKHIVETNLSSAFYVIYSFRKLLKKPGGRIINISSLGALSGSRQGGVSGQAYSAAKAGLHGMTRTLANDLGKEGITINLVAPGVIGETDFFPSGIPEEIKKFYVDRTPLGRIGRPDEIAAGIFFLASDDASFITGELLNINGGVQFGR